MLNKTHLPLLHAARALIDSGEEHFICLAVVEASYRLGRDCTLVGTDLTAGRAAQEAIAHIEIALEGCDSLDEWLAPQLFGVEHDDLDVDEYGWLDDQLQLCRLAWLDKLILDLEAA